MSRTSFLLSLEGYPRSNGRPNIMEFSRAVSEKTGVPLGVMYSTARERPEVHARQEVFALADRARYSRREIGEPFGRDHTTVSHGIKAHMGRNTSQGETA